MPGLRDMLDRFRRAGTPGPAARAGVPVDRGAEVALELEPVLARLADTQAECRRIRAQAARSAEEIKQRARAEGGHLVADAESRAEAVRAQAAAREQVKSDDEASRLAAEAEHAAMEIRAGAERRMPGLVARVVDLVRDVGSDLQDDTEGRRP